MLATGTRPAKIPLGLPVVTDDGARAGKVVRLVIDQSRHFVTQLVVGADASARSGKLIDIGRLDVATVDAVRLPPGSSIDRFPDFAVIERHPLPQGDPTHPGGTVPIEAEIRPIEAEERSWPVEASQEIQPTDHVAGTAISRSTQVVTVDGRAVGVVAGATIDHDGTLTRLDVEFSDGSRSVGIPPDWIRRIGEEQIGLGVTAEDVEAPG
jgi:sporulation protein YlmC with PRC-barrel domain